MVLNEWIQYTKEHMVTTIPYNDEDKNESNS